MSEKRSPEVEAFIQEVIAVCRRHKLSILCADPHRGFEVWPFDEDNLRVLADAEIGGQEYSWADVAEEEL